MVVTTNRLERTSTDVNDSCQQRKLVNDRNQAIIDGQTGQRDYSIIDISISKTFQEKDVDTSLAPMHLC